MPRAGRRDRAAGRARPPGCRRAVDVEGGLTLSTIHRAKGLEWDAVFLPGLEEGILPIGQAAGDPVAIDEERRLLYVAITRARRHLAISWAGRRSGANGREGSRRPSRFLADLGIRPGAAPPRTGRASATGRAAGADRARAPDRAAGFEALRTWRAERARSDGVPAYVIAHDATLLALVEARPASLADLGRVKGMGPGRLERYGPEILAALARS